MAYSKQVTSGQAVELATRHTLDIRRAVRDAYDKYLWWQAVYTDLGGTNAAVVAKWAGDWTEADVANITATFAAFAALNDTLNGDDADAINHNFVLNKFAG